MIDELPANVEPSKLVKYAFGQENRRSLLDRYFDSREPVTPDNAWRHVYHLLMWIDPTIGLAHCYESDKCQPGRPWYGRSLAFHIWLSKQFEISPRELNEKIDILFTWAASDLTAFAASQREKYARNAEDQRKVYLPEDLPLPGEDPEFLDLVDQYLRPWFREAPDLATLRALASSVRAYVGQENKRKNLVGEGFEDTLAAILHRIPGVASSYNIMVRPVLHDIPGFYPPRGQDKAQQVDLALVRKSDNHRSLITCKWSFRTDREKQFPNEHAAYTDLQSVNKPFDYVLLTNEFDPARLASVCERTREVHPLFKTVVHVNPAGPLVAYAAPGPDRSKGGMARSKMYISSGRIEGLDGWLARLAAGGEVTG
ncbi:hypothetical protein [Micromonospora sp. C41]|uniref:hypothetical protein n=1 Tax=Micromonospora sp. C41 TaxID=2824878 RepID=UPI001B3648F0|nr:hypothetical protein [Micromonospora sp. C41]